MGNGNSVDISGVGVYLVPVPNLPHSIADILAQPPSELITELQRLPPPISPLATLPGSDNQACLKTDGCLSEPPPPPTTHCNTHARGLPPRESPASHQPGPFARHALLHKRPWDHLMHANRPSEMRPSHLDALSKTASHAFAIGYTRALHGGSAQPTRGALDPPCEALTVRFAGRKKTSLPPLFLLDQGSGKDQGAGGAPKPADRD